MAAPGTVIAEKYRLESELGRGGMGSVWKATHLTLGSDVAIKLIEASFAHDEGIRARFVREAKAAAGLRSPHVVQMIDYGVDNGTPYIAMEMMEGESLADRLDRAGRLSPLRTAQIITEVGRALTKAHEAGIVHRDLKPDNIFLVKNDDEEMTKVLDFGVAKQMVGTETAHMTSTGAVMGTPFYMSPEQAEGEKSVDHRSDIWAIGVVAYECIVGERPFDSDTFAGLVLAICTKPRTVPSSVFSVPAGFDEWFEQATNRDANQRFQSVKEAAQALNAVVGRSSSAGATPELLRTVGAPSTQRAGSAEDAMTAATARTYVDTEAGGAMGGTVVVPYKKSGAPFGLVLGAGALLVTGIGWAVLGSRAADSELVASEETNAGAEERPEHQDVEDVADPQADEVEETAPEEETPEAKPAPAEVARPAPPPRATPQPRPAAAPASRPSPKPAPTPKPAPAPTKPKKIDLGI